MISVNWKSGSETGFRYKSEALRFIKKVCKSAAPDLHYTVNE